MGTAEVMTDSYIGGIGAVSFIPEMDELDKSNVPPHQTTIDSSTGNDHKRGKLAINKPMKASAWDSSRVDNQTDEDKIVNLTYTEAPITPKSTNINKTEEYNVGYTGLSILPWEEFAFNPKTFDDLFYMESNQKITYDPDEVNVFFHGKNVMPPAVGDISENGRSWNIVVTTIPDLRQVRQWLTEKCSVFGVTLVYKKKKLSKAQRAPCLVMMDPSKGNIGDKLYTALTRAMDSLHNQRQFCVEINLNGCVERWCERVLLTDCEAVGAKLIVTSGEEFSKMNSAEDIVCCIACFPVWLIQTAVYKLHRAVVYDDFFIDFDADDLFLHGTFQDAMAQRQQIFHSSEVGQVFRTRSSQQTDMKTLQDLGSFKFICVKKYDKGGSSDDDSDSGHTKRISEHTTTSFSELVQKRKVKVISKEMKNQKQFKHNKLERKTILADVRSPRETSREDLDKFATRQSVNSISQIGFSAEQQRTMNGLDNNAFIESDGDSITGETPRIPEMTYMLCPEDGEEDEALDTKKTSEIYEVHGEGTLFSPRSEENIFPSPTTMSMNNKYLSESSSDEADGDDTNVKKFKFEESSDELETDTDNEVVNNDKVKSSDKGDLINEMRKIEQMLPVEQTQERENTEITDNTTGGKDKKIDQKKKKSKSKSKEKSKPSFGKAMKDLMKTTEDTHTERPSNTDLRYQQARDKIEKTQRPTKTFGISSSVIGGTSNVSVNNKSDEQKSKSEDINENKGDENASIQKGINDSVKRFAGDESSTDGEDVEMIYQLNKAENGVEATSENDSGLAELNLKASGRKTPTVIQTQPAPVHNLDFISKDVKNNVFQTKQTFKMQNSFGFGNKLEKESADTDNAIDAVPVIAGPNTNKATGPSTDIIEEDLDDWGTEIELGKPVQDKGAGNGDSPEGASGGKVIVPPLKLNMADGKKSRRGTNRANSKGKYLGTAVPQKPKRPSKRS